MALTTSQLIRRFEDGDLPTGEDFAQLITSLYNKLETIPASQISGLATLINSIVLANNNQAAELALDSSLGLKSILISITGGDAATISLGQLVDTISAAVGEERLSANSLKDLASIIDDRISQAGGVGNGGGTIPAVVLGVAGNETYDVPASSLIRDFVVIPATAGNIKIGSTPGAGDILDFTASDTSPIVSDSILYYTNVTTVYFTGDFDVRFKPSSYA